MLLVSAHHECVEYQRLQRAYDDAIIVWEQERHSNVRLITDHGLPCIQDSVPPLCTSKTVWTEEAKARMGSLDQPQRGLAGQCSLQSQDANRSSKANLSSALPDS